MPEVFTDDWAQAWCEEINTSEPYREAASDWEGAIVLVMAADPSYGIPEERRIYADLWHGACRDARAADDEGEAPYVISGDPYTWKRVLDGALEPITGLMRGKLKLRRGNLITLGRYMAAARELVKAATRVNTSFPEGWS